MNEKIYFLNNLTEFMEDNDLNISSFSKLVGISRRSITWWRKSRSPKLSSLIKIADYMNCSIDFLLGKSDEKSFYRSKTQNVFFIRYTLLKEIQQPKLTDYQVAKFCGLRTGTVSKWNIRSTPDFEILVKLCEIFGCSFDFLVGRAD